MTARRARRFRFSHVLPVVGGTNDKLGFLALTRHIFTGFDVDAMNVGTRLSNETNNRSES
jgi:hypothetical protein